MHGDSDVLIFAGNLTASLQTKHDIANEIYCDHGKYRVCMSNFVSTSFSPIVSQGFANGHTWYTILLNADCKGIFLNFGLKEQSRFQDLSLDSEYEYLLGRGAVFDVVNVELIKYSKYLTTEPTRYKEIECRKEKYPFMIKHYTLSFVSQPTRKELSQSLSKRLAVARRQMFKYPVINLITPWDLNQTKRRRGMDDAANDSKNKPKPKPKKKVVRDEEKKPVKKTTASS
jgi:hypothetical protein